MTQGSEISAKPEAVAARAEQLVQTSNRLMVRTVIAACAIVVLSVLCGGAWIVHEVGAIRQTQIVNTRRATCQNNAFDVIASDVHLLKVGDKNAADFKLATTCK